LFGFGFYQQSSRTQRKDLNPSRTIITTFNNNTGKITTHSRTIYHHQHNNNSLCEREGNLLATIFGFQEMRPAGYSSVDLPFLVINSLGK
jgi:hypothetical protein